MVGGRYCVDGLIAEGGMSRLYVGHPTEGAGRVAIKQLDVPASPEDLLQFRREYEILHDLDHAGIARALDFVEEGGRHYLVEEFVPGETLDARVQRLGRLPCMDAVRIMVQVLRVLEHLHQHDIVYRDLKPQNVILQPRPSEDGEELPADVLPFTVRLVDFGAARRWRHGALADTVPLGTPGFAAPEQYGKAQSTQRSDVYGAGVLLHVLLTGRHPDPSGTGTFTDPHLLVPDIPPALGQVVLHAVELDPLRRFRNAATMRRAILEAVGCSASCPGCGNELPDDGRPCPACANRRPAWNPHHVVAVLAVVVVLGIAGYAIPAYKRHKGQQHLKACKENLRMIGTALEKYSTDHGGRFPYIDDTRALGLPQAIVPAYLKTMPTCPAAGTDTYSRSSQGTYSPDCYTVVCEGHHHQNAKQGPHYPQYTSREGLLLDPGKKKPY